jgi:hypothetical protein
MKTEMTSKNYEKFDKNLISFCTSKGPQKNIFKGKIVEKLIIKYKIKFFVRKSNKICSKLFQFLK